jgi:hypothetical protein
MKGTKFYRQGDVLLIGEAAAKGEQVSRDDGRIVLAYGEVTGHAHAIVSEDAELLQDLESRFLRVLAEGGVDLIHEEHATITIPQGDYRVVIQREYTPWGERQVRD